MTVDNGTTGDVVNIAGVASTTTDPNPGDDRTTATTAVLPNSPSGLAATTVSTTRIDLDWTDNSTDETAFHIERSPNGTTGWTQIGTVGPNVTAYSDNTVAASETWHYRVRANGAGGFSGYSNTDSATTLPNAPTGLSASAMSSTQIDLSWTDNSSDETAFNIERSPNGTTGWTEIGTVGTNITTYSDNTVSASTTYFYRVRANGAGGFSGYSNTDNATTSPGAPSGLSANTISSTQIDLAWTDNSSDETGFNIERSPNGTTGWTQIGTVGPNVTVYSDNTVVASTAYFYRVRANGPGGFSGYSNIDSATTAANAPSALTVTPVSQTQINLAWTDNSSDETGFRVERRLNPAGAWGTITTTAANAISFSDNTAVANTTYDYRVFAINGGGDSAPSNTATTTTLPNPPAAPTVLTATPVSQTLINLAWTDNSGNETGFRVERRLNPAGAWGTITTTAANAISFSDNTAVANTTYDYRVFAINGGGDSAPSNTATTTTLPNPPAAPTVLTATPVSQTHDQPGLDGQQR